MINKYATMAPNAVMNMDVKTKMVPMRPNGSCETKSEKMMRVQVDL
jgi:hypothetical protein